MSYMRKSIRLKNKSNYFIEGKDKTYNTIASPYSYQFLNLKQQGYENRLYYEFQYTLENSGITFFYTLTYNDAHVPQYQGQNCFDYNDLRWFLNGGFRKFLLRNYGTQLKYFVGAELGEGAGSRGYGNNPHYHILFFLTPANDARYPYTKISPRAFRHLVREYWQGFDEDFTNHSYRSARFGRVMEGDFCGEVRDIRAINYVSKYVTKDVKLKAIEKLLEGDALKEFRNRFSNKCRISQGVGEYALQSIDPEDPKLRVPTSNGWQTRPINMYYYRKLYTKVVKDDKGQPIYVLNERGIQYKCNKLHDNIKKLSIRMRSLVAAVDEPLYNDFFYSFYNDKVSFNFTYDKFKEIINRKNDKIYEDYAIYKLVYEDRYFPVAEDGHVEDYPVLNIDSDYRRFITPSYGQTTYSVNRLELFLETNTEGYLPYSLHPAFLSNISVFRMFDSFADYLFAENDRQNQQRYEEIREAKRLQKNKELSKFFSFLR